MADNELDVRQLRKPDKHPTIFATDANLPIGGSFVQVNGRDRKPLHEQFEADHASAATAGSTSRRADESLLGALRLTKNLLIHRDGRRGVARLHRTFRKHPERLIAVAIVAHKPVRSRLTASKVEADVRIEVGA